MGQFLFVSDQGAVIVMDDGWKEIGTLGQMLADAVPEKSRAWATPETLGMDLVLPSGKDVRVSEWHFEPSKRRRENTNFPELLRLAGSALLAAQEDFKVAHEEAAKKAEEEKAAGKERAAVAAAAVVAKKDERMRYLEALEQADNYVELAAELDLPFGADETASREAFVAAVRASPRRVKLSERTWEGMGFRYARKAGDDNSWGGTTTTWGVPDPKESTYSFVTGKTYS